MNVQKRIAAVLLCAVMVLMMTACGGSTPAKLEWANSRTKKYFDAQGVTAQEFTLTASMSVSGQKTNLKFAVKGKRAGYELDAQGGLKVHVDEEDNVYQLFPEYTEWRKYPAGSTMAESHAPSIRACYGYFMLPDAKSVSSIAAGKYKMNGETYDAETLKLNRDGACFTYTYCYKENELCFILMESANGMMENISLKPTADEEAIAIPQNYLTVE